MISCNEMNPTDNTTLSVPIRWETAAIITTQRGRLKQALIGIPGPAFWHHWKKQCVALRGEMASKTITVSRVTKGQWELRLWINAKNIVLAESIAERFALTIPSIPDAQDVSDSVEEIAISASESNPF